MTDWLSKAQKDDVAPVTKITGQEAAKAICSSPHIDSRVPVGFNEDEANRFGVKLGQMVSVTPTDNGT